MLLAWLLLLIGNHATNKRRVSHLQNTHQLRQLFLLSERRGNTLIIDGKPSNQTLADLWHDEIELNNNWLNILSINQDTL